MDLGALRTTMCGDSLAGPCKSAEGNKVAMIYGDRSGLIKPCPLPTRESAHTTVPRLCRDVGFPARMTTDAAPESVGGKFGIEVRKTGTTLSHVGPHTPRLNCVKMRMGHLKQGDKGAMRRRDTPTRLWDDCVQLQADIMMLC